MAENDSDRLEEMTPSEMEEPVSGESETESSASVEEVEMEETAAQLQDDEVDTQDAAESAASDDVPVSLEAETEPVAEAETEADADSTVEPQDEPEEEAVSESEDAETDQEEESDRYWFVVHCYSGYENKVRHNLEQRIETMGMKSKIFDVVVPTEEEIEIKDGKRRTVERRVFPGYILVQMIMDEDSWYVVRNTPGVTGFVGMGNEPTPLRPEEVSQIVKRMEAEAPRIKVTYKTGQKVRIIDGPFNDFIGTVSEIDMDRAKVRVMVSFFGRETPVELDFLQVEKA
ncbi:MAG: transcription termination/antitermination protein NusG [Anaerolineales bacterium]|jgi:transcriptional antiterminator NusG